MLQTECNVHDLLTAHITTYLATASFSFDALKTILLKREPITSIHQAIIDALNKHKFTAQEQAKATVISQFTLKQIEEDRQAEQHDAFEESEDQRQNLLLSRELNHIPTRISDLEMNVHLQQQRIESIKGQTLHKTQTPLASFADSDISASNALISQYQQQIVNLNAQAKLLKNQLHDLDTKARQRQERQSQRKTRACARLQFQSTNQHWEATLTPDMFADYVKLLEERKASLDKNYEQLTKDALALNYALFVDLLEKKPDISGVSPLEKEAIKTVIQLIRGYFRLESEIASTRANLASKTHLINESEQKLQVLEGNATALENTIKQLNDQNERLRSNNVALAQSSEQHAILYQKTSTSVWLLLSLTCLFSIPHLLYTGGLIPPFSNPVFVTVFLSAPPILLFASTLCLAFFSVLYLSKAQSDYKTLQINQSTIAANEKQLHSKTPLLKTLREETLPTLTNKVQADKQNYVLITNELDRLQNTASLTLKQAENTRPLSASTPAFFQPSSSSRNTVVKFENSRVC